MSLNNSLAMNFVVDSDDLDGTDYVAVVTKSYADDRADLIAEIPYSEWTAYGNDKQINFNNIAAKEMGDNVSIVIYDAAKTEL